MTDLTARIPCTPQTLSRVSNVKREGERYEDTLQRLLPDEEAEI